MKKPANLLYGVDERPPLIIGAASAIQLAGVVSIFLFVPLVVGRQANFTSEQILNLVSITFIVMGAGSVLQALKPGYLGSGYLCGMNCGTPYLAPMILAGKTGGLSLLCGMMGFTAGVQIALAPLLHRLRALLPPEMLGLIVLLGGIAVGSTGVSYMLGDASRTLAPGVDIALALATLAVMVILNIWTQNRLRTFCVLIGTTIGYAAAALLGRLSPDFGPLLTSEPILAFPDVTHHGWSFDLTLAPAFTIAALANILSAMGVVITCQKTNDDGWRRAEPRSVRGGVLAMGVTNVLSAILGGPGLVPSSAGVGLAAATGVTSRRVAFLLGGLLVILGGSPKLAVFVQLIPPPVLGATLVFSSAATIIGGLQIVTSRLFDPRRTLTIGLSIVIGTSTAAYPDLYNQLPAAIHPLVQPLLLGTLSAILLNLFFRIGIRRTVGRTIEPGDAIEEMEAFLGAQGARWGARREVVSRAIFGMSQSIEAVIEHCRLAGPITLDASFDEASLDILLSYRGELLELR
ncbi:MAG TPA: solute carrier family 23 protein, partial [Stellaceae bacterium]|nr:solute carrier family 23 protein [Stellaceae bacterium]